MVLRESSKVRLPWLGAAIVLAIVPSTSIAEAVGRAGLIDDLVSLTVELAPVVYDCEQPQVKVRLRNRSGRPLHIPELLRTGVTPRLRTEVRNERGTWVPMPTGCPRAPSLRSESILVEGRVWEIARGPEPPTWMDIDPEGNIEYLCEPSDGEVRMNRISSTPPNGPVQGRVRTRMSGLVQDQQVAFTLKPLPSIDGIVRVNHEIGAGAHTAFWCNDLATGKTMLFFTHASATSTRNDAAEMAVLPKSCGACLRLSDDYVIGSVRIMALSTADATVQFVENIPSGQRSRSLVVRFKSSQFVPEQSVQPTK